MRIDENQMGQMSQKTLWVSRTVQVEYLEGVQGLGLRGHIVCPGPHRLGSMINQLYSYIINYKI